MASADATASSEHTSDKWGLDVRGEMSVDASWRHECRNGLETWTRDTKR